MKVAIVRYNGGNTVSVINALIRLGAEAFVSDSPDELSGADKVIFPGVGEASSAMASLRSAGLDSLIPQLVQPVLGICLGMQLMCEHSEENETKCLGILPERAKLFRGDGIKVPQVGWNTIIPSGSPLFKGVAAGEYMYFVHSYYVESGPSTTAKAEYSGEFAAAVAARNFYGVQFHPERSGKAGSQVLENFLDL